MDGFSDHDDAAYAADAEGPAAPISASSPQSSSAAAFRRHRSMKHREFGLYASRLRQHQPPPPTKHDDGPPVDDPLRFDLQPRLAPSIGQKDDESENEDRNKNVHQPATRSKFTFVEDSYDDEDFDDSDANPNNNNSSSGSGGSSRTRKHNNQHNSSSSSRASKHKRKHKNNNKNNNGNGNSNSSAISDDDDSESNGIDANGDDTAPQPLRLPRSPISPRWASLANSASVLYSPSTLADPTAPVPPLAAALASASTTPGPASVSTATSSAPTSPTVPKTQFVSATSAQSLSQPPSARSSRAKPLLAPLSSHPFVLDTSAAAPGRTTGTTFSSPSCTDSRNGSPPAPSSTAVTSPASLPPSSTVSSKSAFSSAFPLDVQGTMQVSNFSRPRKPSLMSAISTPVTGSTAATSTKPRSPEPVQVDQVLPLPVSGPLHPAVLPPTAAQSGGPRERARGLSLSSTKSASAHSVPHRPSNDHLHSSNRRGTASTRSSGMSSPGLPRPPAAYSRMDGAAGSPSAAGSVSSAQPLSPQTASTTAHSRDPLPWVADGESRSSFRSQLTASTAQGTSFTTPGTERSSVLTKTSSRTSMSWYANTGITADEGLSVEDVMGMYEKGFGDSTGAEDNDLDTSLQTDKDDVTEAETEADATLAPPETTTAALPATSPNISASMIASRISEAVSDSLPVPQRSFTGHALEPLAMEATNARNRPRQISNGNEWDDARDKKRDSAKMLDNEDGRLARLPPLSGPNVDGADKSAPRSDIWSVTALNTAPAAAAPLALTKIPSAPAAPALTPPALTPTVSQTELPRDTEVRDRYGFRTHNQYISREQYESWNRHYSEYIVRRRKKWVVYLKESGLMTESPNRFPPPSVKTKRFVRKGIPPEWRGAAWFYYAGGPSIVAKHPGIYDRLIARAANGEAKDVAMEEIERDLHRTFPDNIKFQFPSGHQPGHGGPAETGDGSEKKPLEDVTANRPKEPEIVSKLRRVLLAFSIYNPRIGYCQSLNFLAGLLLLFVETEEQCFWLLNVITRIYLPGTHEMSLEGSKVDLGVLMTALQESIPQVWAKIGGDLDDPTAAGSHQPQQASHHSMTKHSTLGRKMKLPKMGGGGSGSRSAEALSLAASATDRLPPITLCMTAWFMSCFIGTLPIETTLRVWDIFFYEGSKTLFRVALAIFKLGEAEIRSVADPMEMYGVVQGIPRRLLDCNMLMEATFRRRNGFGHLSQESIEEKRRERRDALKEARRSGAGAGGGAGSRPQTSGGGDGAGTGVGASTAAANLDTAPPALTVQIPGFTRMDSMGMKDTDDLTSPLQGVQRKGTLFGRRRDRWPAATEVK